MIIFLYGALIMSGHTVIDIPIKDSEAQLSTQSIEAQLAQFVVDGKFLNKIDAIKKRAAKSHGQLSVNLPLVSTPALAISDITNDHRMKGLLESVNLSPTQYVLGLYSILIATKSLEEASGHAITAQQQANILFVRINREKIENILYR